ncbi:hypothetical protein [Salinirubrum litoreum]|uniref:Uncharacterized protein n=1 Tax=Salinirubrum litoreum TaxID=1126234 RepID=A0ABD5RAR5_9EURY|nr:hypothetical protein [Salinirubrum litoreum]
MSESDDGPTRTQQIVRVLALVLVGVVAAGAISQLSTQGLAAAPSALISLYVVSVVAYGTLRDEMDTTRFRVAFYVGVALWGALRVYEGDGLWALGLFVVGAALLVRELYAS